MIISAHIMSHNIISLETKVVYLICLHAIVGNATKTEHSVQGDFVLLRNVFEFSSRCYSCHLPPHCIQTFICASGSLLWLATELQLNACIEISGKYFSEPSNLVNKYIRDAISYPTIVSHHRACIFEDVYTVALFNVMHESKSILLLC